jgi:hypothetical protein
MQSIHFRTIVAVFGLASLVACAETPTGTPVKTRAAKGGDVNTGLGSLESERRRLQGAWELTSLQIFSPTGEPRAAQANGRLQYDEYGNLTMRGTITGGPEVDNSVLNIAGRVEIDPVAHTLRFRNITARSADERRVDPQIDASLVRYYEFDGDLLKTMVKAANGSTTATATWKRIQQ